VVVGANDGGGVHACVGPMSRSRADDGAPSSDLVSCIYLLKNYYSNSSNGIVAMRRLLAATVCYDPWLQCLSVVVKEPCRGPSFIFFSRCRKGHVFMIF
jgi:hypothetical protein